MRLIEFARGAGKEEHGRQEHGIAEVIGRVSPANIGLLLGKGRRFIDLRDFLLGARLINAGNEWGRRRRRIFERFQRKPFLVGRLELSPKRLT